MPIISVRPQDFLPDPSRTKRSRRSRLRSTSLSSIDNPFDYHTFIWNDEPKLTATFTATLSGGFDCGVLILDTPALPTTNPAAWLKTARAFAAAAKANKARAVVLASFPENMTREMMAQLTADGIAPMMGFDDTLTALEAAAFIGENWARNEALPALAPSNTAQAANRN